MELKTYIGTIISKKSNLGTRSEGPEYYLKLEGHNEFGQIELFIRKDAQLWQEDPQLQKHVGHKVMLKGEPIYTKNVKFDGTSKLEGIIYNEITLYE